jgi:hypothetical protein
MQARRFTFRSKEGRLGVRSTMKIAAGISAQMRSNASAALHARMPHVGQIFLARPTVKKAEDE